MEGFNPPPSPGWPAHSAGPAKIQVVYNIWITFCKTFEFLYRILPTPKSIKNLHFSKTYLNLKMSTKWNPSDQFWMPVGAPFSIKFRDMLNLLKCNMYNAKASFLLLRAPPFRNNFPSEFHVFQALLLVTIIE